MADGRGRYCNIAISGLAIVITCPPEMPLMLCPPIRVSCALVSPRRSMISMVALTFSDSAIVCGSFICAVYKIISFTVMFSTSVSVTVKRGSRKWAIGDGDGGV